MSEKHRIATRALILAPDDSFLLFLSHFDPGSGLDPRWVFPGGGMEAGETELQCILREIHEETGLEVAASEIIDLDHTIHHEMEDKRIHQTGQAHFFEYRAKAQFEPSQEFWTESEHRDTVMHRWWSIEEVIAEQPWIGPDGAIEFLLERFAERPRRAKG